MVLSQRFINFVFSNGAFILGGVFTELCQIISIEGITSNYDIMSLKITVNAS